MMYEKMEEDYDYTLWENAYREYEQSGRKSRPASEFWEEVGL